MDRVSDEVERLIKQRLTSSGEQGKAQELTAEGLMKFKTKIDAGYKEYVNGQAPKHQTDHD